MAKGHVIRLLKVLTEADPLGSGCRLREQTISKY